ncbi:hypothetical protein PAAG_03846 [Paracoccidioides lutzii Pb01]|uniref:Uncharacterized protein n=1 Tax=Paracoccidioides lutzii (strain ATCC MYA-826 / Pb01) TaxID=502779 RepID=C1GZA2_PARBA|nr:hypothetical protein PAAG_03846 [Paracoccidioides lutzii Pb01]EEH41925.2 hypothetical protein PAAG_03846 [Paracoccidioides lutzii Pb01]
MRPIALLLPSLILLQFTLCATALPFAQSLLSRIDTSDAAPGQDVFALTSPYELESLTTEGRRLSSLSTQESLDTRRLQQLRDLYFSRISLKEVRKIILWLQEIWLSTDGLIQCLQELAHIGTPNTNLLSSLSTQSSTLPEKPLPSTFLMQLEDKIEPALLTSGLKIRNHDAETLSQDFLTFPKADIQSQLEPAFISNNLQSTVPRAASSVTTTNYKTLAPSLISGTTAAAVTDVSISWTIDGIDALIRSTFGRPIWTTFLVITTLAILFLISVLIVEVTGFLWTFARSGLSWLRSNCSWWRWQRAIRLSGAERRLIAVPATDSDEKRVENSYAEFREVELC